MAGRKSEENYKLAKSLYYDISDNFYDLENKEIEDRDFLIDQTLEDIKKLKRYISRINIEELEDYVEINAMNNIKANIEHYKEAAYFIEKSLNTMQYYDAILDPLTDYIDDVSWQEVDDEKIEAKKKIARHLTDNYAVYKNQINAIIRNSMADRAFYRLFNGIKSEIKKPKKKRTEKYRHPLPPEMYPEKERKAWEKQMEKMRKGGKDDEKVEWDITDESFTTFKNFKKLMK